MKCYLGALGFLLGLFLIIILMSVIITLLPVMWQHVVQVLVTIGIYAWLVWICKQENK